MKDIFGKELPHYEMYDLINRLIVMGVPFKVKELLNTPQVIFYDWNGNIIGDAICHDGCYGHECGLLEIMGLDINEEEVGDSVIGYLSAEEVVDHYIHWRELHDGDATSTNIAHKDEGRD